MRLIDISGAVSSDLTARIVALRAQSVWLGIIDAFCISNPQKHLVVLGQTLEMRSHCASYLL